MNFYFLIEGNKTEKKVYKEWVKHVFPALSNVASLEEIIDNHYFMLSGNGYPSYIKRIENAISDIRLHKNIDHFFICIDAEENAFEEKYQEIETHIKKAFVAPKKRYKKKDVGINYHIIVQHCCIETWFLGNATLMKRNPESAKLREWKKHFDVSSQDPENMQSIPEYEFKAHFHLAYLKEMLKERELTYSKSEPGCVREEHYLKSLVERHKQTGHLQSLGKLIYIWKSLGGNIG